MTPITLSFFTSLTQSAKTIEADHHGVKVLQLSDGSYLKLFRRKRLISSEIYQPYASRFAHNAQSLKSRKILCPDVIATYKISSLHRTAVQYHPLPGQTMRQYFATTSPTQHHDLCRQLGRFIAQLHEQGVYFRSLHLGNIIIHQDELGLIDIADMRCSNKPLNIKKRKRNFNHLLRYEQDKKIIRHETQSFIDGYCRDLKHYKEHMTQALQNMLR